MKGQVGQKGQNQSQGKSEFLQGLGQLSQMLQGMRK